MSTAPPTLPGWDRAAAQQRVRHPLHRLRGFLRTYVTVEGLLVLGLYLALWFWIGLALDYGVFRLTGIDWVQVFAWEFRAAVLGVLVTGLLALVAVKMLLRLFRDFSDPALALVLERRFPHELGDRLITAVQLADTRIAERYGFSQAMIDSTVRDAAEQVDRLPLKEVFDWRRLKRAALWFLALTAGLYLAVGAVYCAWYRVGPLDFVLRFHAVEATWFERNILLRNVIWPRTVYLELLGFPEGGELKLGRDAAAPTLRARALRWVVPDQAAPEGWRAMKWGDVNRELLGEDVPAVDLPAGWADGTLDQLDTQRRRRDTRDGLPADTVIALDHVFERLEEQAASPAMTRRLRQLAVPAEVRVHYRMGSTLNEQTFKKAGDAEYTVTLGNLKESIRFTVRAEDYATPEKRVTLVPPPSVVELARDEFQPAYLYHRPPRDGTPADLRGKKHEFRDLRVSLSGATSQIQVPVGTDLVLRGRTDKPLAAGVPQGVRIVQEGGPAKVPLRQVDEHTFEARFPNIETTHDFQFEFTDTDGVLGRRHVVIRPVEDRVPEIDAVVDGLPKRKGGYMITPMARVPLAGKVRDDHGLARIEWAYTLVGLDAQGSVGARALATGVQFVPFGMAQRLAGAAYVSLLSTLFAEDAQRPTRLPLESFAQKLQQLAAADVPAEDFPKLLTAKPASRLVKEHLLDPTLQDDDFQVERLGTKVKDEKVPQPRYRLQLWLVAADNNVEAKEPGVSQGKEKFLFQIVSEYELLSEIGKDEEGLHVKLLDVVTRLRASRDKLEDVARELPELKKPDQFSPMARRTEEQIEVLLKSSDVTREVHADYLKVLRELQLNQVQPGNTRRVRESICDPLADTLKQNFPDSEDALRELFKQLEGSKFDKPAMDRARQQLDRLLDRLGRVLDAMGELMSLNKLIETLVQIEKLQRTEVSERLAKVRNELEKKILEDLLDPKKP